VSEQQADTAELERLVEALTALTEHCQSLQQSANGFAYMLPAQWQGPAMGAFLAFFEMWSLSAASLTEGAHGLALQASSAHKAYEATIHELDTAWSKFEGSLG